MRVCFARFCFGCASRSLRSLLFSRVCIFRSLRFRVCVALAPLAFFFARVCTFRSLRFRVCVALAPLASFLACVVCFARVLFRVCVYFARFGFECVLRSLRSLLFSRVWCVSLAFFFARVCTFRSLPRILVSLAISRRPELLLPALSYARN